MARSYFPPSEIFEQGFVNKFYHHFQPYDKDSRGAIRISYTACQSTDDKKVKITNYNAGFEATGWQYYHMQDNRLWIDSAWYILDYDTIRSRVEPGPYKFWDTANGGFFKEQYTIDSVELQYISHQYAARDTVYDSIPALKMLFARSARDLEQDSTRYEWKAWELYLKGRGLWATWEQNQKGIVSSQVVEQMSLQEFERRANHGKHRVAWIDPDRNLGSATGFKICGREQDIADYYNGEPDAHFLPSKKDLVRALDTQVPKSIYEDFSGFITIRFVISCEGILGRLSVQAYDENYQKTPMKLEDQEILANLFKNLGSWQATQINGEARDAYAYVSIKIQDGKIQHYLP